MSDQEIMARLELFAAGDMRQYSGPERIPDTQLMMADVGALIRDLRAARGSAAKLNRRCQEAESKLVKAQRQLIIDRSGSNLVRELVEVRAERNRLREALAIHGSHGVGCTLSWKAANRVATTPSDCDCGLNAALAPVKP